MFAVLIAIGGLRRYWNVELIYSERVGELLPLSYWMTYIWHHCLVPLRRPFPPTLMDTHKFKSISINESESSNGEREEGDLFRKASWNIRFHYEEQIATFHPTRIAYWNEMCAVWLPERVQASWRQCGVKKKLRWICFLLLVISPLIYLLSKGRLCSRVLMATAAPHLITGWRLVAYGAKMEDDGCVSLWNADQNNASCEFGPTMTDLLHLTASVVRRVPTWKAVGPIRAHRTQI